MPNSIEEAFDILMEVLYYRFDDDNNAAKKVEANPDYYGRELMETIETAKADGERDVYDIAEKYIIYNLL